MVRITRFLLIVALLALVVSVSPQLASADNTLPVIDQCPFSGSTRECVHQNGITYILDVNVDASWTDNLLVAGEKSSVAVLILPPLDSNGQFVTVETLDYAHTNSLWVEDGNDIWSAFQLPTANPIVNTCEIVECLNG